MRIISSLCLLVLACSAAAASLYRWVDADGKVHYTDQPPPSDARTVEEKRFDIRPSEGRQVPYAVQVARKDFPVTLYIADCGEPCAKARELLRQRDVPYAEKDVMLTAEQEALKKLTGGRVEVPLLIVGKNVLRGFSQTAWNDELDKAGYPKAPAAGPPTGKPSR